MPGIFIFTWFPTYLKEQFPALTEMQRAAVFAGVPLLFADWARSSRDWRRPDWIVGWERRIDATMSRCVRDGRCGRDAADFMQFSQPMLSVLAVGLASLCNDFAMPGAWGACMDVGGPQHRGRIRQHEHGRSIGGAIAPMVVPIVLAATHNNWSVNIALFAAAYFLGAVCWAFIDTDARLHSDAPNQTSATCLKVGLKGRQVCLTYDKHALLVDLWTNQT